MIYVGNKASPGTELLECLTSLTWGKLPAKTKAHTLDRMLDGIACGLFGSQFPWSKIVTNVALKEGSSGGATILGTDKTISPAQAALCNGTMIHGYELDDISPGALAHPGTVVIPAALAMGEHRGSSPEQILLAIVVGYELMARLGKALGTKHNEDGYHTTSVVGPVASAVTASIVAGLSYDVTVNAVGIACSSAAGLKAFTQGTGGMVKRLHGGNAAAAGITACLLAENGFSGPTRALDGRFGLLEVFGRGTSDVGHLTADLGRDWAIDSVWTKMYPCCGLAHTSIQALESICSDNKLSADAVKSVILGLNGHAVHHCGEVAPTETMSAQFSLPFCAALAISGNASNPASFDPESIAFARALSLIPQISLHLDPDIEAAFPKKFSARVELVTTDRRKFDLTVWDAYGTPLDPCTRADLEQKFQRVCRNLISSSSIENIVMAVRGLTLDSGSINDLSRALQRAASKA